ncbi:MAG TPA: hypothetical protein VFO88_06085 [Gaiellaceae bacterium]|nr:hypothetical protein [Gaiellaceae bacterium]
MTPRRRPRWASTGFFAAVVLAFFLPFGTVSCSGSKTPVTGIQLATWTVADEAYADAIESEASLLAALALVATLVGLGLSAWGVTRGPGWCAGVALAAFAGLGWKAYYWGVETEAGFSIAWLLLGVVWVLHVVGVLQRRQDKRRMAAVAPEKITTERSQGAYP